MSEPYFRWEWKNRIMAKPWELLMAKLFGKKFIGYNNGMQITIRRWRGKSYVTKVRAIK